MARRTVLSSESVTAGHPDKMCDQISDGLVDAFLYLDPKAEVAAECAVATGLVFLAVHYASSANVDITGVARHVIEDIGYSAEHGFNPQTCSVITSISHRTVAPTDHELVTAGTEETIPASNQASVFGFACDDTRECMPLPIVLAHRLAARLDEVRRQKALPYLGPDGKTLVAVAFEDHRAVRVQAVIVNVQHTPALAFGTAASAKARLEGDIRETVLRPVFEAAELALDRSTKILVNPAGAFLVGGPQRDAGLTGRKNMVDTYGGYARHGGAALSGKDPSHIDRLGAYVARYVAKQVVAAALARRCEVHLSYAVGEEDPLAVSVETFGTGRVPDDALERAIEETIDLTPATMIQRFQLRALPLQHNGTFYRRLAVYGHFGRRELDAPWEREDQATALRHAVR